MKFSKTTMHGKECYISESGRYKVVKYYKWTAFFKPDKWTAFGNACALNKWGKTAHFKTKAKAMSICRKHAKKFKDNLNQSNSLIVEISEDVNY